MTITTDRHTSPKLVMGHSAPMLDIQTLNQGPWNLNDQTPENYTMIVFYRGLHCPLCAQSLVDLESKLDAFQNLGITAIAISGDTIDQATHFQRQNNLQQLTIGYGLSPEQMRDWGLYISKGHFSQEPTLFSEPALFLIKPNGDLYFANIGSHPFSRVNFDFLLNGLEYVIANDYPFRGTES